ncbi:MAG: TldD/PmbA family protein [Proteobacteria bacterium]|nr:TldD/PmbA family protein [Pseudomonadota bacterium]
MSQPEELKARAERILQGAQARGLRDVIITVARGRSVSLRFRLGRPEEVEESATQSAAVQCFDEGRYTASTTNDFRPEAFERFLDNAVALTRVMSPDPFRRITDPALYAGRADVDLQLCDDAVSACTQDDRLALAEAAYDAAMSAANGDALFAESAVQQGYGESWQLHSNGFSAGVSGTQNWLSAQVSLRDQNDRRPSGYGVCGARFWGDLLPPSQVGEAAVLRARQQLDAVPIETARLPMVVENRVAARLLGGVLSAISGQALQQQRSFLAGKQGTAIGAPLFHLTDEPHIAKGLGSRLFDGEGISAKPMPVVSQGVWQNAYVGTYYGRKLDMPPTTAGPSNLIFQPGASSLEQLIASVSDGVLVRGFLGGNTNSTTGDFSFGVYGTRIEKGRLGRAVSGMNISGSFQTLWHSLSAVGSDPWRYSAVQVPSLLFSDVQFSGN